MRISRAPDAEAVKERLVETAAKFGFTSIFAGRVPAVHPPLSPEAVAGNVLVSTMPKDWSLRYLERGYLFRDPIVQLLRSKWYPFTWAHAYDLGAERADVEMIRGEASEFGLREGYVVPIGLLGGVQLAFSFGANSMDVSPDELGTLAFATNIAAGQLLELTASRSNKGEARLALVTARERDCLAWAAEGKTDWEIAAILGISVSTVRKHLASTREKLEAVNKYHAVALGIRSGLLR